MGTWRGIRWQFLTIRAHLATYYAVHPSRSHMISQEFLLVENQNLVHEYVHVYVCIGYNSVEIWHTSQCFIMSFCFNRVPCLFRLLAELRQNKNVEDEKEPDLEGTEPLPSITAEVSPFPAHAAVHPVTGCTTVAINRDASVRQLVTKGMFSWIERERESKGERDLLHNRQHSPPTSSWASSYSKR